MFPPRTEITGFQSYYVVCFLNIEISELKFGNKSISWGPKTRLLVEVMSGFCDEG